MARRAESGRRRSGRAGPGSSASRACSLAPWGRSTTCFATLRVRAAAGMPVASEIQRTLAVRRAVERVQLGELSSSAATAGFADTVLQAIGELESGLVDASQLDGDLPVLAAAYRERARGARAAGSRWPAPARGRAAARRSRRLVGRAGVRVRVRGPHGRRVGAPRGALGASRRDCLHPVRAGPRGVRGARANGRRSRRACAGSHRGAAARRRLRRDPRRWRSSSATSSPTSQSQARRSTARFASWKAREHEEPSSCSRASWRHFCAAGWLPSASPSSASPSIAGARRSRARSRSSECPTRSSTGDASPMRLWDMRWPPCSDTPGSEAVAAISSSSCAHRSRASNVGRWTSSKDAFGAEPSPIPLASTRRANACAARPSRRSSSSEQRTIRSQPPAVSSRSWCGTRGGSTHRRRSTMLASTRVRIEPPRGRSTSSRPSRPAASGSPPRTSWPLSSGRAFLRTLRRRGTSPFSTTSALGHARSTSSSCSGWRRERSRAARGRRRS